MCRVRELRLLRGMTQLELAHASGLALTTVVDIETGKKRPRIDTAQALAAALGTTVDVIWPMQPTEPIQA